jgi:hypothetical protein
MSRKIALGKLKYLYYKNFQIYGPLTNVREFLLMRKVPYKWASGQCERVSFNA